MNLSFLETSLIGTKVDKPSSGTLSGHAAGEPFDKHVEALLKSQNPNIVYRQYEYLNKLYLANPAITSCEGRYDLLSHKALQHLLNRGKDATKKWAKDNLFEEKQDDTADILIVEDTFYQIIDVKTRNLGKKAQQPNIISALKLAEMCKLMIENNDYNGFNFTYVGIDWSEKGAKLECEHAYVRELFKAPPADLYINWAAALQIQFHVEDLNQQFTGSTEEWAKAYLSNFVQKAKARISYMKKEWVDVYEAVL